MVNQGKHKDKSLTATEALWIRPKPTKAKAITPKVKATKATTSKAEAKATTSMANATK